MYAAMHDNPLIVKTLTKSGANVNVIDKVS